ncbi:enoyl-CoA hydratase-related protein [Paraburkholderia sp. MPAMCS5]|uniref:enoyl-CoA hydratase-related protein n=1 Tax=Paraburkholderia sp. MPAMCS5 TaxID=3112563 RepID=UPI003FA778F9
MAFSEELENSIKRALATANKDTSVESIVVTGGVNRSFSAGGDFNEVRHCVVAKTLINGLIVLRTSI